MVAFSKQLIVCFFEIILRNSGLEPFPHRIIDHDISYSHEFFAGHLNEPIYVSDQHNFQLPHKHTPPT